MRVVPLAAGGRTAAGQVPRLRAAGAAHGGPGRRIPRPAPAGRPPGRARLPPPDLPHRRPAAAGPHPREDPGPAAAPVASRNHPLPVLSPVMLSPTGGPRPSRARPARHPGTRTAAARTPGSDPKGLACERTASRAEARAGQPCTGVTPLLHRGFSACHGGVSRSNASLVRRHRGTQRAPAPRGIGYALHATKEPPFHAGES